MVGRLIEDWGRGRRAAGHRGPRNPAPWTTDDRSAGGRRPGGDPAHPLARSRVQTVLLRAPGTRSCPSWNAVAGGATRPPTVRPGVLRRPGRPIVRWVSGNPDRAGRA